MMTPEQEKELQGLLGGIQSQKFDDLPTAVPPEAFGTSSSSPAPPSLAPPAPDTTPTRTVAAVDPSAGPPASSGSPPPELAAAFKDFHPGAKAAPEDDGLASARETSRRRQSLNLIGRAGTNFASAVAGHDVGSKFWDEKDKADGQQVADLVADRGDKAAALKLSQEERDNDPTSDKSRAAQAMIRSSLPEYAKLLGDRLEHVTAADIANGSFLRPAELKEQIDARKQASADRLEGVKAGQAEKAREAAAKAAGEESTKQGMLKTLAQLYPEDFPAERLEEMKGWTKEAVEKTLTGITGAKGISTKQEANVIRREGVDVARQGLGITKATYARDTSQLIPADYEQKDPEHFPQKDQAADLAKMTSVRAQISDHVAEIKRIIAENGGVPLSATSTAGARVMTQMQLLKPLITTASGMGNFTVAHEENVNPFLGDPTTLQEWAKNAINKARLPAILSDMDQTSRHSVDAFADSVGLRRKGSGPKPAAPGALPAAAAAGPPAPAGKVKVRRKADGKTGTLDANDPALKSGTYELLSG